MANTKFHGADVKLIGDKLVAVGDKLDGKLTFTTGELKDVTLDSFDSKVLVLNFFPSIDTPVCAFSVKEFNSHVNELEGAKVLCVSADLPFALGRFCGAEGLNDVINLSVFRNPETVESLGLRISEGPLKGLSARAVVILDKDLNVKYVDLSNEIGEHVDYEKALATIKSLL